MITVAELPDTNLQKMQTSENLVSVSRDNFTRTSLTTNSGRRVLRLVNASDSEMMFAFKHASNLLHRNLVINPRKGTIAPRSHANIVIEDLNYNVKLAAEIHQLNLIYWINSSTKSNKGVVKIDLMGNKQKLAGATKEQNFTWAIFSTIRSTFLLILVVYNIFLIKYCF